MALDFSVFANFIWTRTEILPKKKTARHSLRASTYYRQYNEDFFEGTVSSALLKRAGPRMQLECSGADQASSTIRCTKGGNLLCDYVIHVVTPHEADKLTKRIKEALDHAELLKANSVSLPTLGAGRVLQPYLLLFFSLLIFYLSGSQNGDRGPLGSAKQFQGTAKRSRVSDNHPFELRLIGHLRT